jgi:hypothetical protein
MRDGAAGRVEATGARCRPDAGVGVSACGDKRLESVVYLPGTRGPPPAVETITCPGSAVSVRLTSHVRSTEGVRDACDWGRGAALFTAGYLGTGALAYELHLVPASVGFSMRRVDWATGTPRIALATPWFDKPERTRANVVDLVAHESSHLLAFFAGEKDVPQDDEYVAYYFGVCAQLAVNQVVRNDSLPGSPLDSGESFAIDSSKAAARVRHELASYAGPGDIRLQSRESQALLGKCREVLGEPADTGPPFAE